MMLSGPLPGLSIQSIMSPVRGDVDQYYKTPKTARLAAVMALLIPQNDEWNLTLIKRPKHPRDLHSGQISFPGGGIEDGDQSFEECAVRETYEEIGIPPGEINIIGSLTKLYVYASNNLVYPFVGYVRQPIKLNIDPKEVERVIHVPISYISNPSIIKLKKLKVRGYTLPEVPYYDIYGEVLWGATAMMISELIHLWQNK